MLSYASSDVNLELQEYESGLIMRLGSDLVSYIMATHNQGEFNASFLIMYDLDPHFRKRVDQGYEKLNASKVVDNLGQSKDIRLSFHCMS